MYVYAEDLPIGIDHIAVNNAIIPRESMNKVNVKYGDTVKIGGIGDSDELLGITVNNTFYTKTIDGNGNWFAMFSVLNLPNGEYDIYSEYTDKNKNEKLTTVSVSGSDVSTEEKNENSEEKPFVKTPIFYILLILLIPLLISFGWYVGKFIQKKKQTKDR
jgi:hypothetical protein